MRNEEILDSWKAISDYLDRDIRTCARWEKELKLPIYRIDKDSSRSKVFAYKSEIDEWLKDKANHKELRKKSFIEKKWPLIGIVSAVVLLLAVSVSYIANGKISSANPENLSIAVLTPESFGFSDYEQYIPEGICNEIFDSLSNINNFRVIRAAPFERGNNSNEYLNYLREKFKVNHFLKTKIEKKDNKIKIYSRFVRIEDKREIWNHKSQDRLENLFDLKEDICLKIHMKLNPNNKIVSSFPFNNGETQNNAAYDNYLKGNHILNRANSVSDDPWKLYIQGKYYQEKWTKESNNWAISFFSKAIELDENFAKAYIRLARCYLNYLNFNWDYDEKWLSKAEELLKKASLIDPECSEYFSTLILVYLMKYLFFDANTKEKAFELARQAVKKFPGCPLLRSQLGFCHYLQFGEYGNESDFNKALEHNEESYFLRPYHINNIRYAELLMLNREYDRALMVCNGIQRDIMADFRKGEIYYYLGDLDSSEAVFLQFQDGNDFNFSIGSLFHLGMIAARRGDASEVERIINKISVIAPKEFYFFEDKLKLASIYMGIGKKEWGYDCLEAFFRKEKMENTRYISLKYIKIDKNFDNCREEERFKNLINNWEE